MSSSRRRWLRAATSPAGAVGMLSRERRCDRAGLFIGGVIVSIVGLTGMLVPTDLAFLGTRVALLAGADAHLVPFAAHDRAGFGGRLAATAMAITVLAAWGWAAR